MEQQFLQRRAGNVTGFLASLASDRSGNTLAMVAAAIAPILAMVGSSVDMGRSYLAQTRLQQACDAGVLAARKELGTDAAVSGEIPSSVGDTGQQFFNVNFSEGDYGTRDTQFDMQLEEDFSVSGLATVNVPSTIMRVFGYMNVPVKVACKAQLNMSDTDVVMVLDVTGSMATVNAGDSASRIDTLKATILSFYKQLSAAGSATRIRYGFVPYSTNVNVGALLADEWVTDEWTYQSRELVVNRGTTVTTNTYEANSQPVSGTKATVTISTYAGTFVGSSVQGAVDGYVCSAPPASTVIATQTLLSSSSTSYAGPPAGTQTTKHYQRNRNGLGFEVVPVDGNCEVRQTAYVNYVDTYDSITVPAYTSSIRWRYKPVTLDVSDWRTTSNGCMEERDTYEITDYANVDLDRAKDLDIDGIPDSSDPSTQWRPMFPDLIYERSLPFSGFSLNQVLTLNEFTNAGKAGWSPCPAAAKNLSELTESELTAYLATLSPRGNTYHDIGMIWGGRMISPTGLFSAENAPRPGHTTKRNLIFLTDGETAPRDVSYGTYGVEPLDRRRWSPTGSPFSLTQTVEKRFSVACEEVKKRNVTVWVIGFGTTLNSIMTECAGSGHFFNASNAEELNEAFVTIAKQMADLRISG